MEEKDERARDSLLAENMLAAPTMINLFNVQMSSAGFFCVNTFLCTGPEQIIQPDQVDLDLLQEALKEGSIITYRVRVMVIGQDRTGKSSLVRSLLNKLFDALDSTGGINITSATFPLVFTADEDGADENLARCEFTEEKPTDTGFCEEQIAQAVTFKIQQTQQRKQLKLEEAWKKEQEEEKKKKQSLESPEDHYDEEVKEHHEIASEEAEGGKAPGELGDEGSLDDTREVPSGSADESDEELQLSEKMKNLVAKLLKEVKVIGE